jgi:hypothetical protein
MGVLYVVHLVVYHVRIKGAGNTAVDYKPTLKYLIF